jgi:hypothetical protein
MGRDWWEGSIWINDSKTKHAEVRLLGELSPFQLSEQIEKSDF